MAQFLNGLINSRNKAFVLSLEQPNQACKHFDLFIHYPPALALKYHRLVLAAHRR